MSGSKGQEIVYTWARLNTPTHKELSDTIDAALRRAKAEVWREAAMELHSKSKAIRTEAVTWGWGETAEQLSRIAFECDARAAQIEEGE